MSKGLYIHIPFCIRKCKYCDFTSFSNCEEYFDNYIGKLLDEAKEYEKESIDTVFIGGGTPSILSPKQLYALISELYKIFNIKKNSEFSIEANPKTVTKEKLSILKDLNVNRISLGVQSFVDSELSALGRVHNSHDAIKTAQLINDFSSFELNLDLMMAIPHQTKESLINSLDVATTLNPDHISCYSLIIEENTPLYHEYKNGVYEVMDDDVDRELYHKACEYLKEKGYSRYEISNFSKKGYECRHNLKYWNCDEYIGLGVSAHSYVENVRYYNTSDFNEYLCGNFHEKEKTILTTDDKISEYIIMRLRLSDGIFEKDFFKRFNIDFGEKFEKQLTKLISAELIEHKDNKYFLTERGIDISNSVMCEFV